MGKNVKFCLSASKPSLLHLCNGKEQRGYRSLPAIVLDGETIPEANAARFLGTPIRVLKELLSNNSLNELTFYQNQGVLYNCCGSN